MRSGSPIIVERIDFDGGWKFTYHDKGKDVRVFVDIYDSDSPDEVARKLRVLATEILVTTE